MAKTIPAAKSIPAEQPLPTDQDTLKLRVLEARRSLGRVRRDGSGGMAPVMAHLQYRIARLNTLRPMRVFQLYLRRHGPLMAAGIAYNMFFSIAALLVAGFSILGLVVAGNTALQDVIVETVDSTTPGLIGTGNEGLASRDQLFSDSGFGLALVISTIAMLFTSLGWIAGVREGMRGVFDLPPVQANPVVLKLKDLGTLLILAVALVLTTLVGIVANTLIDVVLQFLGWGDAARPLTQLTGVVVTLVLDMAVAVILFRGASGIDMSRTVLFQAALIAGVGSTVLRTFSTLLLANVDRNPLLAPFAVILGLFVWFFLLSQVYLIATAWGAIGQADVESSARAPRHGRSLRQQSRRGQRADGAAG